MITVVDDVAPCHPLPESITPPQDGPYTAEGEGRRGV